MSSISADQRNMENRFTQAMSNVSKAAISSSGSPEDFAQFTQLLQQASGVQYAVTTRAEYSHNLTTKIIDAMP